MCVSECKFVYDVVDEYGEGKRNQRKKNYKTTQVGAATAATKNSSLYHEKHGRREKQTKKKNRMKKSFEGTEKKLQTTNVWTLRGNK